MPNEHQKSLRELDELCPSHVWFGYSKRHHHIDNTLRHEALNTEGMEWAYVPLKFVVPLNTEDHILFTFKGTPEGFAKYQIHQYSDAHLVFAACPGEYTIKFIE